MPGSPPKRRKRGPMRRWNTSLTGAAASMSRRKRTIRWRSWRRSGRWWAITNGNARPELFGLSDYFRFVLRAGPDGRSKPFADMYHLAAERLNVPLGKILHVGDDLTTDVAGAIRCGMQACWIKPQGADLMHTADSRLLPHIEISRLASLTSLI